MAVVTGWKKSGSLGSVRKCLESIDWSFPDSNKADSLHGIHPYPAKFIPEIPRTLIRVLGLPPGTQVFDPFCGSGTTLVEAQAAGYPAIGVDLNPIACLISRVKTTSLPVNLLSLAATCINIADKSYTGVLPSIPNLDHWFEPVVQEALASLLKGIEQVCSGSEADHLKLALSSIIVRVSNQDSDTRYAAVQKRSLGRDEVFNLFKLACERLIQFKRVYSAPKPKVKVLESDILQVNPAKVLPQAGLVITSPPYPNAYEYWLYHKYRMWWLGCDPLAVKAKEIGARAHYFRKTPATIEDFRVQMDSVIRLIKGVLSPVGYLCVVIGRSRIHGKDIDNAGLISAIAKLVGFQEVVKLERAIASSRKSFNLTHARIRNEHILVFRNEG